MPEYLAPGVFVEEVSYRSKSIEGVSTTTTGFVGPTRSAPCTGTSRCSRASATSSAPTATASRCSSPTSAASTTTCGTPRARSSRRAAAGCTSSACSYARQRPRVRDLGDDHAGRGPEKTESRRRRSRHEPRARALPRRGRQRQSGADAVARAERAQRPRRRPGAERRAGARRRVGRRRVHRQTGPERQKRRQRRRPHVALADAGETVRHGFGGFFAVAAPSTDPASRRLGAAGRGRQSADDARRPRPETSTAWREEVHIVTLTVTLHARQPGARAGHVGGAAARRAAPHRRRARLGARDPRRGAADGRAHAHGPDRVRGRHVDQKRARPAQRDRRERRRRPATRERSWRS